MKTLKFTKELSELILEGKKKTTWRLFDDKELSVGDLISLVVSGNCKEFACAKIVFVKNTIFDKLIDEDWEDHEKFDSNDEMYKSYEKYYNCKVDENTSVKIIKFEIL